MKFLRSTFAVLILDVPTVSFAKRGAPQKVEPAITSTLKIIAPLDDGRVGRIQAFDRVDGRLLWSLVVFENKIDPKLEEDVQWRFIRSMKVVGDTLEVIAEGGTRYRVTLATRKIEALAAPRKEANQSPELHLRSGDRGPGNNPGTLVSIRAVARLASAGLVVPL